jgi:tripartite-type tricarboxylate transporter receptor subunit TctC
MKYLLLALTLWISSAVADPVKIIVQYQPGGVSDRVARTVQTALEENGIATNIEYKLGAGGFIAYNYFGRYRGSDTVIMVASNGLTDGIGTGGPVEYEFSDFIVIKHLGNLPSMLVVSGNHPAKTFKQLLELSATRPITYGTSGVGTGTHVAGAIVGNHQGNFVNVPYKGQAQALVDVLGGQIDFIMEAESILDQYIKAGKVRPLAVMSAQRLPGYPDVPTLRELGVNDYSYTRWSVLVANKTADPAMVARIRKVVSQPEFIAKLSEFGQRPTKTVPNQLEELSSQFQKIRQRVKFD